MKFLLFFWTVITANALEKTEESIRRYEGSIGDNLPVRLLMTTRHDSGGKMITGNYAP